MVKAIFGAHWWPLQCFVSHLGGKETQHDVWKYNSSINKWIQIEYLNIGRWRHKMVVLGGKVYVIGGFDGMQRINNVETYDPFHNCWSEVAWVVSLGDVVEREVGATFEATFTEGGSELPGDLGL